MMVTMLGSKVNYTRAGAGTTCLLILALIVGPLCTPLCAGSSCLTQTASSDEKASCHGVSSSYGRNHFSASPKSSACQETGLAVLSKPILSVESASFEDAGSIVATGHSNAQDIFAVSPHLIFSWDGPPPEIREGRSVPILRI